jgi:hypothetical protein
MRFQRNRSASSMTPLSVASGSVASGSVDDPPQPSNARQDIAWAAYSLIRFFSKLIELTCFASWRDWIL